MENGTEFTGAVAWCKKYNLCFMTEYHYMQRALERFDKEERVRRMELEKR